MICSSKSSWYMMLQLIHHQASLANWPRVEAFASFSLPLIHSSRYRSKMMHWSLPGTAARRARKAVDGSALLPSLAERLQLRGPVHLPLAEVASLWRAFPRRALTLLLHKLHKPFLSTQRSCACATSSPSSKSRSISLAMPSREAPLGEISVALNNHQRPRDDRSSCQTACTTSVLLQAVGWRHHLSLRVDRFSFSSTRLFLRWWVRSFVPQLGSLFSRSWSASRIASRSD